jgi:hypothetical protein
VVWPLLFGGWCVSGLHLRVGDFGNLFATIIIGSPNVLGPLLFSPEVLGEKNSGKSGTVAWHGRYWFKFNLWIAVFTFVASYFWTEYFFDVLRMNYNFPHLTWNLDAVLLGVHLKRLPRVPIVFSTRGALTGARCGGRPWSAAGAVDDVLSCPLFLRYLPRCFCCRHSAGAACRAPIGDLHSCQQNCNSGVFKSILF